MLNQYRSAPDQILKRAKGIEASVLSLFDGTNQAYKSKIRSLFVNLKDKNNPGLRENVVSGDISVDRFSKMSSEVSDMSGVLCLIILPFGCHQEMASEERKAADNKIKEQNFQSSLGAEEQQAETDAFQCSRCKQVYGSYLMFSFIY